MITFGSAGKNVTNIQCTPKDWWLQARVCIEVQVDGLIIHGHCDA